VRYVIEHETSLAFPSPVREHQCELRLTPRHDARQRVLVVQIDIDPQVELFTYVDSFGNRVHHFSLIAPHDRLVTRLHTEVETLLENPFDYTALTPSQEHAWFTETLRLQPHLWSFVLHRSAVTPDLAPLQHELELPRYDPETPLLHSVQTAMDWIAATLTYRVGVTDVHSPLETVLAARAGVCQDFAHLLIALVRFWGFPARYVMGYLDPGYIQSPDIKPTTHAWAEVLIPGAGWRGFDATLQLVTNDTYVAVAVGRDDQDAAPQRGSFKGEEGGEPPQVNLQIMRQQ
jgi:transglutaminase-like putative cysteine protease